MKKRTLIIAGVVVLVVALPSYVMNAANRHLFTGPTFGPIGAGYDLEIPSSRGVPLILAQVTTGFEIRLPRWLPSNLALQSVRLGGSSSGNVVYLFYYPSAVSGTISLNNFTSSGGVVMIQSSDPNDPTPII